MTTHAMPLLLNRDGKHLELRNAADEEVPPVIQLKTGEEARAAARRAIEEFFGMSAPEDAIKDGFQARVGNDVVAVYPIDAQRMDMDLLRPAESIASWAWKDVPKSMGNVVALGFPRNLGVRRNAEDKAAWTGMTRRQRLNSLTEAGFEGEDAEMFANAHWEALSSPVRARLGGFLPATRQNSADEAAAQYAILADAASTKVAALKSVPAHEFAARHAEAEQALEDLRLLRADMGIEPGAARLNSETAGDGRPLTARALIRQNDGTILAARQKDGRSLLPGGHLENGETPEDAVARELQEELGLDIRQALTGESYDFTDEDGSSHRVFEVDGSKLDLSKMTPGDDVGEVEIVNSPFTDSHGVSHPQNPREASDEGDKGDVEEIERHVAGIQHEIGELERQNAERQNSGNCPACAKAAGGDAKLDALPSDEVFTKDHRVHMIASQNGGAMKAACGATLTVTEAERKNSDAEMKRAYVMDEFARGQLTDGHGNIVTDKDQALAIAYSESGEK